VVLYGAALLSLLAMPAARAGPAPPARIADEERHLAADSFRWSAVQMAAMPASTPARAARMVVLCRFADRLWPGEPQTKLLLADIDYAAGDRAAEAAALADYLRAFPADHARQVRWMQASLVPLNTARQRIDFLKAQTQRDDLAPAVRAVMFSAHARIAYGQGDLAGTAELADKALKLDRFCPDALRLQALLRKDPTPAERLATHLGLLQGDCRDWTQAWQAGVVLSEAGLHADALGFYEHAWRAAAAGEGPKGRPEALTVQYCNALLDAGQPQKAISEFGAAAAGGGNRIDLMSLLVEAYRAADQQAKAADLVRAMEAHYRASSRGAVLSLPAEAELGWFYVATADRAELARTHAELALKGDPNNVVYRRIMGVVDLLGGRRDEGRKRLEPLVDKDLYAAVYLARDYDAAGQAADARRVILAGAALTRSGPAYRQLAALAKRLAVELPAVAGAAAMAEALKRFDRRYLQAVQEPEKFLRVSVRAAQTPVACGQPIALEATLTNIGSIDLPVGQEGLLCATMAFQAVAGTGPGLSAARFTDLPTAVWPAPRYLRAGQSVSCEVRLDAGGLAETLARRPLEDLSISTAGVLDPVAPGRSSLPGLKADAVVIARTGLLGDLRGQKPADLPAAYRRLLGRMVGQIRRGTLPQRMLTARQIGSLLAYAREVELARARPPEGLAGAIDKMVLLSMMRAVLGDPSPAVRQEMVAALAPAPLDATTVAVLAPAVGDAAPMVRCRAISLLAGARTEGYETLVNHFAADSDELVRAMAAALKP